MQDTILIVDDEATVRQTVREWLAQAQLDCDILAASDAESALKIANQQPIDLAAAVALVDELRRDADAFGVEHEGRPDGDSSRDRDAAFDFHGVRRPSPWGAGAVGRFRQWTARP